MEIAVTTAVAAKRWQASARKGVARRGSAPSLLGVARDKSEEGPRPVAEPRRLDDDDGLSDTYDDGPS